MAKRKVKKAVKQQQQPESNVIEAESIPQAPTGNKDDDDDGALKEVEHQIDAIRSIRYLGIERLRTELRLLHSYFKEEQLQTPLLQFFETNLPNISLRKENDAPFEVQWKQDQPSLNHVHGSNIHASLLHQISSYPNFSATVPSFQGYEHSSQAVKTSLPGVNDLQIGDSVLEELSRTQMFGYHDALQTPGASSQRMSFGMTPKTTRLPKKGEMILSVHGSPLGVFKEDNMELDAISESED